MRVFLFAAFLSIFTTFQLTAQNWPCFRGPEGDGTSTETSLPVKWDSVTNVIWKTGIPGSGYASPVIWGDRLFTVTAIPDTQEKVLLCYNTKDGKLVWKKTMLKAPFEKKHNDNSHASGTPATDGNLVYVSYLDGDDATVAAYDFSGKQVWISKPGKFSSPHGYSCSPVLYKDKVIINGTGTGQFSFFAALSRKDGSIIWKVNHDKPSHSFSTPILREMAGKMQLIMPGNKEISSYNPDDGTRYWYVDGPSEDFCNSPVYSKQLGLVFISSAWPQRILVAVKPDGKGNVTESHVAWKSTKTGYYVASPVLAGNYLFITMTNGLVNCIDAGTGQVAWSQNMGTQYSSGVYADGLVYMPNDKGEITVIKPGPEFDVVSKNSIGEKMNASMAVSNGRIYIRGAKNLYCIGKKN